MSKTLTVIQNKLDEKIGEEIYIGTTSGAGADTVYLTAVDTSLARYEDGYFKNWYLYIINATEERMVESFLSPSGTLTVYEGFTARVATSTTYRLSRFSIIEKLSAINEALDDSYSYFYNRITGVLIGQHTDDSNDQEYLLTSIIGDTFTEIPQQLYIHDCYEGEHTGSDGDAALTDTDQDWETSELVGHIVYNVTDSSYGTISANTATTVTATLANGTDDDWDKDDEYLIAKNLMPDRSLNYKVITGDRAKFYADVKDNKLILCVGQAVLSPLVARESGAHDGSGNAAVLTDSGEAWEASALIGYRLDNITDSSYTTVTANTSTTITGVLANGTDNDWDASDVYLLDSVTELDTDEQVDIIVLKAAANLYRKSAATVDSSDTDRFKAQIDKWEWEYWYRIQRKRMSPLINKIGIDWSAFE